MIFGINQFRPFASSPWSARTICGSDNAVTPHMPARTALSLSFWRAASCPPPSFTLPLPASTPHLSQNSCDQLRSRMHAACQLHLAPTPSTVGGWCKAVANHIHSSIDPHRACQNAHTAAMGYSTSRSHTHTHTHTHTRTRTRARMHTRLFRRRRCRTPSPPGGTPVVGCPTMPPPPPGAAIPHYRYSYQSQGAAPQASVQPQGPQPGLTTQASVQVHNKNLAIQVGIKPLLHRRLTATSGPG